jgi:hypothetical protein
MQPPIVGRAPAPLGTGWRRRHGDPWPGRREGRKALAIGALMLGGGMGAVAVAETTVGSGPVVPSSRSCRCW